MRIKTKLIYDCQIDGKDYGEATFEYRNRYQDLIVRYNGGEIYFQIVFPPEIYDSYIRFFGLISKANGRDILTSCYFTYMKLEKTKIED